MGYQVKLLPAPLPIQFLASVPKENSGRLTKTVGAYIHMGELGKAPDFGQAQLWPL